VSGTIVEFGKDAAGNMLDAGMTVKAGDVLFRLDETTFRNAIGSSEAALKSAQAALANLTAKTRPERMEQLRQGLAELDARLADRQREQERFRRLVEDEKTLPAKRLEDVQTELAVLRTQRKAAQAKLEEAENGPTPTEIAVAAAQAHQAQTALKIAQDDLRDSTVRAPFDGAITKRFVGPGDYCTGTPHTEVLELVSMDKLEVELRLPEAYYSLVQPGKTQVTLRSPLLKADLKLPVTRVVARIDASSGMFPVRVAIPPASRGGIVPGVFVSADVSVDARGAGVIVPLRAIVMEAGKAAVFVAQDGKMARREVDLGDKLTESAVVKAGLEAGQKVVVGPAGALKDGAALPEYLLKKK
jgi:multidrug efflux pump subunit AcrA (membrane-fusion protein)